MSSTCESLKNNKQPSDFEWPNLRGVGKTQEWGEGINWSRNIKKDKKTKAMEL